MSGKGSNMKTVDKQLEIVKKQFARQALILKKVPSFLKKAKAFGRATGGLPPEPFLATLVTYMVAAMARGGKNPKSLLKMLESELQLPSELCNGLESLAETLLDMEDYGPLLETDAQIMIGLEDVILDLMEFDSPYSKLSVATLIEEVRKVAPKVVSSDKGGKDAQIKMFFTMYSKFLEKLKEFNVTTPEKIAEFLHMMTSKIQLIKIKKSAEVNKNNGK